MQKLTPEEIKELNEKTLKESEEEYAEFIKDFKKNVCYLCKERYTTFIVSKPCMHWLLRPEGLDKKHLPAIFENFDFFRIYALLCWIANTENLTRNINNLRDEKPENKVIELTIKYKEYEWSFSSSQGCFEGKHGKEDKPSGKPHYHFQMKINGRIFVQYSDFHIPFTEYDLYCLFIQRGGDEQRKYVTWRGGIQDVFDVIPTEALLDNITATSDEDKATFHLQTFLEAEKGKTISGDEVADLMREHKETGVPLAKLVRKLKNVSIKTVIMPGPAIPEIAGRMGGRGSKRKK